MGVTNTKQPENIMVRSLTRVSHVREILSLESLTVIHVSLFALIESFKISYPLGRSRIFAESGRSTRPYEWLLFQR